MVDFLVLGSGVAAHYSEVFPLFKEEKVFFGYSITGGDRLFGIPDDYDGYGSGYKEVDGVRYAAVTNVRWFTSLGVQDKDPLDLDGGMEGLRFLDGQEVLNVDRVCDIPRDYKGVMAVPLTFLDKWSRKQFEVVGIADTGKGGYDLFCPRMDGVGKFTRVLIRRRDCDDDRDTV